MASRKETPRDAAYWYVPVARAVPAALAAVVITFTADHSPSLGFVTFGLFAVLSGLVVGVLGFFTLATGALRSISVAQGGLTVTAGAVALLWPGAGLGFLLFLLSLWAALTGFLELYAGVSARHRHAASRDLIFIGALTVCFALVVLVVPPGLQQQYTGPDGVDRVLSSSVVIVGAFGAYGAIAAVYLLIAGLSLKWGTDIGGTADAAKQLPAQETSSVAEPPVPTEPQDGTRS